MRLEVIILALADHAEKFRKAWPIDCPIDDERLLEAMIAYVANASPYQVSNFLRSYVKPPSYAKANNESEPIPRELGGALHVKSDFNCSSGGGTRVIRSGKEMT